MAIMLMHFEVDDYDAWKPLFDEDPAGRAASGATSHMMLSRGRRSAISTATGSRMIEKWQCFLIYSLGVSAIFRPSNALAKISFEGMQFRRDIAAVAGG